MVDQADEVASAWRGRYDRLRLNTCRPLSHLPGRRVPEGHADVPSRDQMVEHLDRHAREDGIDLQLGTQRREDRPDRTAAGRSTPPAARSGRRQVIVATGYEQQAYRSPDWPGREAFAGELVHSGGYRNAEPFARQAACWSSGPGLLGNGDRLRPRGGRGRQGLAVGTNAAQHHPARRPGRASRRHDRDRSATTSRAVRRRRSRASAGRSDIGDLSEYGLQVPEEGILRAPAADPARRPRSWIWR